MTGMPQGASNRMLSGIGPATGSMMTSTQRSQVICLTAANHANHDYASSLCQVDQRVAHSTGGGIMRML
jgi:hypothetical protein